MADQNEHINKSIKDSFDSAQRKAPEDIWTKVSQEANLTEDEFQIRESFNDQAKIAPSESWNNVKKQLIIDEVWEKIALHEDRKKRRFIWWYVASACFVLLFSLKLFDANTTEYIAEYGGFEKSNKAAQKETDINQSNSPIVEPTENQSNDKGNNVSPVPSVVEDSKTETPQTHIVADANVNDPHGALNINNSVANPTLINAEKNLVNASPEEDTNNEHQSSIALLPFREIQLFNVAVSHPLQFQSFDSIRTAQTKHFEVGLIAGFGNSWLFDNNVKNGLNNESLVKNELSTGWSIGTVVGYNFTKKSCLELGYDIFSVHNQGYSYYDEGRFIRKNIRLKQQKVNLAYKLRFKDNAFKKRNFVMKTGVFFAHSMKEETTLNGIENTADSSYDTFDYGLNLGIGIEHNLSKFKIEYGLKSDIGLYNITSNSDAMPKKFNYASTFLLGGYLSVRYLF